MLPRRVKINYKSNIKPHKLSINRGKLIQIISKLNNNINAIDKKLNIYAVPDHINKMYLEHILIDYTKDIEDYLNEKNQIKKSDLKEILDITNNKTLKKIISLFLNKQELINEKTALERLDFYLYQETLLLEPSMLETGEIIYKEPRIDNISLDNLATLLNMSYIHFPTLKSDILQNIDLTVETKTYKNTRDILFLKDKGLESRKLNVQRLADKSLDKYKINSYFGREIVIFNEDHNPFNMFNKLNNYELKLNEWDYLHLVSNAIRKLNKKKLISAIPILILDNGIFIENLKEGDVKSIENYIQVQGFRTKIMSKINI